MNKPSYIKALKQTFIFFALFLFFLTRAIIIVLWSGGGLGFRGTHHPIVIYILCEISMQFCSITIIALHFDIILFMQACRIL